MTMQLKRNVIGMCLVIVLAIAAVFAQDDATQRAIDTLLNVVESDTSSSKPAPNLVAAKQQQATKPAVSNDWEPRPLEDFALDKPAKPKPMKIPDRPKEIVPEPESVVVSVVEESVPALEPEIKPTVLKIQDRPSVELDPVVEKPVEVIQAPAPVVVKEVEPEPEYVPAPVIEEVLPEPIEKSLDPEIVEEIPATPVVVVQAQPIEKKNPDSLNDVLSAVKAANEQSKEEEEAVVEEPVPAEIDPVMAALDKAAAEVGKTEEVVDEEPETDEVIDDMTVDAVAMDSMNDAEIDSDGQLISVRLNKVGLEDAITLFAQLSGANIIVPELADAAQVSVNLKDVEWRPALQSILDSYNYELYQKVPGSNVYSVRRREEGAPEPMVVETFKLEYATVPNAAKLVKELLPENAKISEFASRNMLVIKSTESAINEIRAVLDQIDQMRQQVFIESKFMELSSDAQKDLGVDWKVLQGYGFGTKGETSQSYFNSRNEENSSSIFRTAEGQQYDEASGFINSGTILGGVPVLEGLTPSSSDVTTDSASKVLTSVLSADQFRVVLSALEDNKGANIISNPKIIVANEEKANISIVREEPNLQQERRESGQDNVNDLITYKIDTTEPWFKFGITLDVTPSINTSSNITVEINPSLTRKFGDKIAGTTTYPIIDRKSIQTVFSLASGETAAIGGLTEVTDSEVDRKIPVLGSIPFLGKLFSYKQNVKGQQETIIFVTVGLANTEDIRLETGLPEDTNLARRQLIRGRNKRKLEKEGRLYFEQDENERLRKQIEKLQRNAGGIRPSELNEEELQILLDAKKASNLARQNSTNQQ